MRHFTLVNNSGDSLDITTTEILFHDISGLGFDEDNDFRQIGDFWLLNRTGRRQSNISGSVIFNEGNKSPYTRYREFVAFISKAPLIMLYNPFGEVHSTLLGNTEEEETDGDSPTFRRTVRVAKLDKTELNEYGVLDCSIEFICYTPWYEVIRKSFEYIPSDVVNNNAWIFGRTLDQFPSSVQQNPPESFEVVQPLVFQPEGVTELVDDVPTVVIPPFDGDSSRTQFRSEDRKVLEITIDSAIKCPAKLTIFGPLRNPSWTHRVVVDELGNTEVVGSGGFTTTANIELLEGDQLVIDGTEGQYSMYISTSNGTQTDVYGSRNFGLPCFISLVEGINRIVVSSDQGDFANHFEIEGHAYHATV